MKLIPHEDPKNRQPLSLRDAMNRLFDEAFWDPFSIFSDRGFFQTEAPKGKYFPQVDVSEDDKNLQVEVNIPGYDPKNVKVDLEEGRLIIQGQAEHEHEDKHKNYYRRERSSGQFYREIPVPQNVDLQKAQCHARNGTLKITIPKTEMKNRKSLEIKED
jgi:HSP20 family protein